MASNDWYLSDNNSDGEGASDKTAPGDGLELGGFTIPPWRVLQLMQMIDQKQTMQLDSVGATYKMKWLKKKKKKKKHRSSKGGRGLEDVSETTSEIRSTTGTSTTATECRDSRRPGLFAYDDPELDDILELPAPKQLFSKKKALLPPTHKKLQLASLDKIAAEEHERQERWKKSRKETFFNSSGSRTCSSNHSGTSLSSNSIPVNSLLPRTSPDDMKLALSMTPSTMSSDQKEEDLLSFGEDSDEEEKEMEVGFTSGSKNDVTHFATGNLDDSFLSESDIKVPVLSQIHRVEQLLDSDGLT